MSPNRLKDASHRLRQAYRNSPAYVGRRAPHVQTGRAGKPTEVDRYWSEWIVHSDLNEPFESAEDSLDYLEWRFEEYPLFREFAGLWGDHEGEVVLDYGCGPGNDVTGLLANSGARKVIGMDISEKTLGLARRRLALHNFGRDRVELIQISDASGSIPLETDSIDYFQSMGVIHITTDPGGILRELHRVVKPDKLGRVMVYNQDSVWFHLYTAYVTQIVEGRFADLSVEEAFQKVTDGEDCPIARAYSPAEFGELCADAGFDVTYVGGHLSRHELDVWAEHRERALADARLDERHKQFLREVDLDADGYPMWHGKHAGVGAVYELRS